jgi:hypothetical protein
MSRNGSGVYSLPAGNPVVPSTTISTTWANTTLTDIATALTGSLAADGQTPATGNLNMNTNQIKNVVDPTLAQDAATKAYVDTANALSLLKASNLSDVANATTSRTNLSAAKSGANSDITSITGLTTALTVAQGGTGVTTSTGSGANVLGTSPTIASPTISGAVVSSMASSVITAGTAVASTSGTSIDFTSIPSWVKRISIVFMGVSTSGTSPVLMQIGSGSITTTGYNACAVGFGVSTLGSVNYTNGFGVEDAGTASYTRYGTLVLNSSGNTWTINGGVFRASTFNTLVCGGIALGGTLDCVRITTVNGTDTFDAGSINILYE